MGDHKSYDVVPEDELEWDSSSRKSRRSQGVSEDRKLELRLGPPGDDHHHHQQHQSQSLFFPTHHQCSYASPLPSSLSSFQCDNSQWLHQQHPKPSIAIPSPCTTPTPPPATASKFPNSAAANCCSKKRTAHAHASAPVVGWPPVRSFRKNLRNSNFVSKTDKPPGDVNGPQSAKKTSMVLQEGGGSDISIHHDERKCEGSSENDAHKFVKINMEGVPIGRKVDLKAYDGYHKLSYAIGQLFQDLVSKQQALRNQYCLLRNYNADADIANNGDQYTLVYEDNEGDRMLVGDVPWQMFVLTAKRLRVLKSSEVSTLRLGSSQLHETTPLDDATMEIGR